MNGWTVALIGYVVIAVATFAPVGHVLLKDVELYPGGPSFEQSPWFTEQAKNQLSQHYERIRGTLAYWKTQTVKYPPTPFPSGW